jgi:pimeloyl-ACP methyl ester carboxylesterase
MPPAQPSGGFIKVRGQRLHFAFHPGLHPDSGPPLVLINGFLAGMGVWERLQARLHAASIAFDLPGSGRSRPSAVPYPMAVTARMVEGLLGALGHETVDVLGLSMGGGIAQQLAYRWPQRVRRLVLAATHFGVGSVPGSAGAMLALASPITASGSWARRLGPRIYGGRARHDGASFGDFATAAFTPQPSLRSHLWALMSATTWWSLPILPFLAQPTLVLAGDDDPLVPLWNARLLGELIPHAQVRVIRGAGHLFVFEDAEQTAAIINRFLASSKPASRWAKRAV